MCYIEVSTLAALANPKVTALAAQYGVADTNTDALGAEIAKQTAEHQAQVIEDAASNVIELVSYKEEFLMTQAQIQLDLQFQIDAVASLMASIQRAQQYADATRNYVPLASQLGFDIPAESRDLAKIPKDWAPAVPVVAAAVA